MAGQTTTAGSVVLREAEVAHRNATIVDRLIAAGAVIVGRTNMILDTAVDRFQSSRNPHAH